MAAESTSNRRGGKKGKQRAKTEPQHEYDYEDESTDDQTSLGEAAERVTNYVSDRAGQIRSRVRETTEGREGTVVVIALAVGFGLGIALGTSFVGPQRRPRSWYDRMACEGLGRRLIERAEEMLPDRLSEYFSK